MVIKFTSGPSYYSYFYFYFNQIIYDIYGVIHVCVILLQGQAHFKWQKSNSNFLLKIWIPIMSSCFTSFRYKMPGCPDKRISLTLFQRENTLKFNRDTCLWITQGNIGLDMHLIFLNNVILISKVFSISNINWPIFDFDYPV